MAAADVVLLCLAVCSCRSWKGSCHAGAVPVIGFDLRKVAMKMHCISTCLPQLRTFAGLMRPRPRYCKVDNASNYWYCSRKQRLPGES